MDILGNTIYIIIGLSLALAITIVIFVTRKTKKNKCYKIAEELERKKIKIINYPVAHELSKLAMIARNEDLNKKFEVWQMEWKSIVVEEVATLTEEIILLDEMVDDHRLKEFLDRVPALEDKINNVDDKTQKLLKDIHSITQNEEDHRLVITDLKSKFRDIKDKYLYKESQLSFVRDVLKKQLDVVMSKMKMFDKAMEENDYEAVENLAKEMDQKISYYNELIDKAPDLIVLFEKVIPKKISEVKAKFSDLKVDGFPVEHFNFQYNLEETDKVLGELRERLSKLDMTDVQVELNAIIEFTDILLNEFIRERQSKDVFISKNDEIQTVLDKLEVTIGDADGITAEIESTYQLENVTQYDLTELKREYDEVVSKRTVIANKFNEKSVAYSILKKDIESLLAQSNRILKALRKYIDALESVREDEVRAREQITEMRLLMKEIKLRVKNGKLPIIPNTFLIQLEEAESAMHEIIREIERRPIDVETLNIRVDTANDLVFKLFNTTNEIVKTAYMAERAIMYGNRYRSSAETVEEGLGRSEQLFHAGKYNSSLRQAISSLEKVEPGIHQRLMELYERKTA
jgi:septation ring formation regulator